MPFLLPANCLISVGGAFFSPSCLLFLDWWLKIHLKDVECLLWEEDKITNLFPFLIFIIFLPSFPHLYLLLIFFSYISISSPPPRFKSIIYFLFNSNKPVSWKKKKTKLSKNYFLFSILKLGSNFLRPRTCLILFLFCPFFSKSTTQPPEGAKCPRKKKRRQMKLQPNSKTKPRQQFLPNINRLFLFLKKSNVDFCKELITLFGGLSMQIIIIIMAVILNFWLKVSPQRKYLTSP